MTQHIGWAACVSEWVREREESYPCLSRIWRQTRTHPHVCAGSPGSRVPHTPGLRLHIGSADGSGHYACTCNKTHNDRNTISDMGGEHLWSHWLAGRPVVKLNNEGTSRDKDTQLQVLRQTCTRVSDCPHPVAVCPLDRSGDGPASCWCMRCSRHVHRAPGGDAPTRLDTHSTADPRSHSPQTSQDHSPSYYHT